MSIHIDYFYQHIAFDFELTDDIKLQRDKLSIPKLPNTERLFSIDNLSAGDRVEERFLINEHAVKLTKTNKQFLKVSLSNAGGMVQAKMWDNNGAVDKNLPALTQHRVFDVEGVVDEYNNIKSLTINKLSPVEASIEPFSLLPSTDESLEALATELLFHISKIEQPYQTFAHQTLNQFWDDFVLAPAAKGYHHNYLGGLLKHTVGLLRFTHYITNHAKGPVAAILTLIQLVEKAYKKEIYDSYNAPEKINRPVWKDTIDHLYKMLDGLQALGSDAINLNHLITAILYHDLGKLLEYDYAGKSYHAFSFLYPHADSTELKSRLQGGIGMDPIGLLVGHIPYGVLLLQKMLEQTQVNLTLTDIHRINHLILCHHGLPEWGSCVRQPETAEGFLIHIVDYLDSRYENVVTQST